LPYIKNIRNKKGAWGKFLKNFQDGLFVQQGQEGGGFFCFRGGLKGL
jgi:hypothetical protein